jgi:hypothetical protein
VFLPAGWRCGFGCNFWLFFSGVVDRCFCWGFSEKHRARGGVFVVSYGAMCGKRGELTARFQAPKNETPSRSLFSRPGKAES